MVPSAAISPISRAARSWPATVVVGATAALIRRSCSACNLARIFALGCTFSRCCWANCSATSLTPQGEGLTGARGGGSRHQAHRTATQPKAALMVPTLVAIREADMMHVGRVVMVLRGRPVPVRKIGTASFVRCIESAFQSAFVLVLLQDAQVFHAWNLPIVVTESFVCVQALDALCSIVKGQRHIQIGRHRVDVLLAISRKTGIDRAVCCDFANFKGCQILGGDGCRRGNGAIDKAVMQRV